MGEPDRQTAPRDATAFRSLCGRLFFGSIPIVLLGSAVFVSWNHLKPSAKVLFLSSRQRDSGFLQFASPVHLNSTVVEPRSLADSLIERCRAPRSEPPYYGVVNSVAPIEIENCGAVSAAGLLKTNEEVTHISHKCLQPNCEVPGSPHLNSAEVVLLVKRRGGVYQLDVVTEGDTAHWEVNLPPARTIKDHSCLNAEQFCDVVSVTPLETGFIAMDRHRVMEFNFTWQPEDNEILVAQFGEMNEIFGGTPESSLLFPSCAAVYKPLNDSYIDANFEMTPLFPYAHERYIFVTDTGNHRVVMLNASYSGQLEYFGQFGVTNESRSDETGLSWPWGLAVYAPAWESNYSQIFANVYVADRRNDRIVKLDLLWNGTGEPQLLYGGQYGTVAMGANYNETLSQPVGVALFRHYILVAEAGGNAITVLTANHKDTSTFLFVTQLRPAYAVQLTGSIAATPDAYVWYTHVDLPHEYGVASMYLPEALRQSIKPALVTDFVVTCINQSWYNYEMRFNETMYFELVSYALNITGTNWIFPDRPDYLDLMVFNLTWSFDLERWNTTVYQGLMTYCDPPPASTTPPMLSGDQEGWKMSGVVRRSHATQQQPWILKLLFLLLLAVVPHP